MQHTIRFCTFLGLLIVSAGCVLSTPLVWVTKTETIELSAKDLEVLDAVTHNGHVHVNSSNGDQIRVEVSYKAGGHSNEDAQACMDALAIDTTQTDGVQKLHQIWKASRQFGWQATVALDVTLPASIKLQAETHNGNIRVNGMKNGCRLETHNGDIRIEDSAGPLSASSHNGAISAQSLSQQIELTTHNGRVEADLVSSQMVSGKMESHNGSLVLHIAPTISVDLHSQTHNGRISCAHSLADVEKTKHTLSGRLGQGRPKLELITHNGSITIK